MYIIQVNKSASRTSPRMSDMFFGIVRRFFGKGEGEAEGAPVVEFHTQLSGPGMEPMARSNCLRLPLAEPLVGVDGTHLPGLCSEVSSGDLLGYVPSLVCRMVPSDLGDAAFSRSAGS